MYKRQVNISAFVAEVAEEGVHIFAEVIGDGLGNFRRQNNLESFFRNIPSHDSFGVRVKNGFGGENFRTVGFAIVADNHGCLLYTS